MNEFDISNTLNKLEYLLKQFIDQYPFMTVIYKWMWEIDSYIVSFNFDEEGKADCMYDDLQRILNHFEQNSHVIFTINEQLFKVPGPYKLININIVRNEKFQSNGYRRW